MSNHFPPGVWTALLAAPWVRHRVIVNAVGLSESQGYTDSPAAAEEGTNESVLLAKVGCDVESGVGVLLLSLNEAEAHHQPHYQRPNTVLRPKLWMSYRPIDSLQSELAAAYPSLQLPIQQMITRVADVATHATTSDHHEESGEDGPQKQAAGVRLYHYESGYRLRVCVPVKLFGDQWAQVSLTFLCERSESVLARQLSTAAAAAPPPGTPSSPSTTTECMRMKDEEIHLLRVALHQADLEREVLYSLVPARLFIASEAVKVLSQQSSISPAALSQQLLGRVREDLARHCLASATTPPTASSETPSDGLDWDAGMLASRERLQSLMTMTLLHDHSLGSLHSNACVPLYHMAATANDEGSSSCGDGSETRKRGREQQSRHEEFEPSVRQQAEWMQVQQQQQQRIKERRRPSSTSQTPASRSPPPPQGGGEAMGGSISGYSQTTNTATSVAGEVASQRKTTTKPKQKALFL